jgi:alpha-beta hydrolase superfamily lysophospholipase
MNEYFIKSKNGKINIIEGNNVIDVKAVILHVHGIGSHFQFVYPNLDNFSTRDNYLSKFNYKSIGFEFHGHGKSDGLHCYINDFNDLIDDLNTVLYYISNIYINKPIYLFAESMGAAVCLKYLIDQKNTYIKGLILISPMCGIDDHLKPSPLVTNILLQTSKIIPSWKLATTTKKMSTENVINKEYIDARNLCSFSYKGSLRLSTVRELYINSLWTPNNAHHLNIPILIFHGLKDKITTPIGTQIVFEKMKSNDKELILLPQSEHCLLVPNNIDDLTPNFIIAKLIVWLNNMLL